MEIKIKRNTNFKIFIGILFFILSFLIINFSRPIETKAACCTHYCCGTVGCNMCVWENYSGADPCNCDGTTLYCDPGPCGTCSPPGCPTGYSETYTTCGSTQTSCDKKNCVGNVCGYDYRTCYKEKYNVYYQGNGGTCTPTSRLGICRGSAAAAPSCSRTNYDLTGFTKSGTCTLNTSTGYCSNVLSNVTITAQWAIKTYTVQYVDAGVYCDPTQRTVDHGSAAAAPSCSRTGYDLTGFVLNQGCSGTFNTSTGYCSKVTAYTVITPQWDIKKYTVQYVDAGEYCDPTQRTVDHGSAAAAPSCSRTGYDLTGFVLNQGCSGTFNTSTGYCSKVTEYTVITPQWDIKKYQVNYDSNAGTCGRTSEIVEHGDSALGPGTCTRPEYNLTGFSIASGSCAGTFNSSTGICNNVQAAINIDAEWEIANVAPTAPTSLLVDSRTSPAVVADTTPYFSAIYNDPNTSDYSETYQIQVNTASDFSGTTMWNTGLTSMTQTSEGIRSPNINYNGSTLSLDGSTYYWKIRFADSYDLTSPYSTVATFTMNQAPTAPTSLETEGATDPTCVSDATPEFTAIFNDPDGHSASQYQIQVNTASDFNGTSMWDSGLTGSINTPNASRTNPIPYAGTTLTFNGTTYYWRIRFSDEYGTVSPWSATGNFKMNEPPTAPTQPLTEELVNPTDVGTLTPTFSAIFNDPDTCSTTEHSNAYEIEVNTSSAFTGSVMWDSGKKTMTTTNKGSRSPEISYDGSALSLNGATYYWRIRFWDSVDSISPWATTSSFTMESNQTPTAPTSLLVNGVPNNARVNDATPEFSAIYNDPNQYDYSEYYELEVNTVSDFTGTVMWDTGKTFMNAITQGSRSYAVTYNGLTLNLVNTTYYWRIRFWDAADAVSPWGTSYFTTSGAYTTFQNLQMGGIINQ